MCVYVHVHACAHMFLHASVGLWGSVYEFVCALEFVVMRTGDRGTCPCE